MAVYSLRNRLYRALQTGDLTAVDISTSSGPGELVHCKDLPAERLGKALNGRRLPSPADLVPLIRHFVLSEFSGSADPTGIASQDDQHLFAVRRALGWPEREDWERHGFEVLLASNWMEKPSAFQLRARPWSPAWLNEPFDVAVDLPAARALQRRQTEQVAGDTFLHEFGLTEYRSAGQRTAIRAVLGMPPGASLIVNLPTGTGKSLCGHVLGKTPFVDGTGEDGVVVVVVPTVALSLDQARAYASYKRGDGASGQAHYAYTGGGKENPEIRRRLLAGEQSIVFVSPEALQNSLRPTVYRLAEQRRLKALVIDEAHIVDAWGDDFRSAFQEIAGLRRALLRAGDAAQAVRFRTVLLSATLTSASVATLHSLFSGPEPCGMVAAVQLRPEPAYFTRRFTYTDAEQSEDTSDPEGDIEEFFQAETVGDEGVSTSRAARSAEERRRDAVIEALRHLPRPAILYVTERSDARDWKQRLEELGLRRLDCMTGDTSSREREKIIRRWENGETDLVVATAAFGLGMDKGDVRTVIHACLPETLDRFYQEAGRGGRDGCACVSLLFYTDGDIKTARNVSARRLITTELGLPRWASMFNAKMSLPDGRFLVNLKTPPGLTEDRLDMVSKQSVEWNARTLTLLQRAGIIELDDAGDITEAAAGASHPVASWRALRIRDQGHLQESVWLSRVEGYRRAALEGAARQRKAMLAIARSGATRGARREKQNCIAGTFDDLYRLETPPVTVARACGGCPRCRAQSRTPYEESAEVLPWPWPALPRTPALARYAVGAGGFVVYYDAGEGESRLRDNIRALFSWLVGPQKIGQVIAPHDWLKQNVNQSVGRPYFIGTGIVGVELRTLPTLVVCPPRSPDRFDPYSTESPHPWRRREWQILRRQLEQQESPGVNRALCVLLMPRDTPDSEEPTRHWCDMTRCPQISLASICADQQL